MSPNELSLLLGLVLAHMVGDFLLQPHTWVVERYRLKHRSRALLWHALMHGALCGVVLLIAAGHFTNRGLIAVLAGVVGVMASHWLIDLAKAQLAPERLRWFLVDQALHGLVLVTVWLGWVGNLAPLGELASWLGSPDVLGIALAYLLVSRPLSIVITLVLKRWSHQLEDTGTLASAGARIGMLERFLVLTLVLLDQLTAVGFLLAAKSVLRFGDLREAQDRKLTEYVLLGTLLSVATTLALGMLIRLLLDG
ncbi:DUF3307 domain-containing protein [Halomonas urumqiensis]|uniref:DUF3307 domain-containing protein n=1 Tax=Halomonas urumqiensis TaxID=1684789 RepID=A0A2N7UQX4_9GAMM|nr:DUF3307 domain-containing protein [Halomonas urumqiensis]PMR82834.1 DUF3307 domain-containing protein [Halomonas urumqiensis]PTB01848.1 DUF3307 domain-containing protein [Halomonas urumqiensis]GHE21950.1 hypothetical protein GCM10017767_24710 [Halomonas urumqiensis]